VNIKPPPLQSLVQTKFRLVLIPLNIDCTLYITKAFLYICSFYIWRPQATRRVGVKTSFNLISKKLQLSDFPHLTSPHLANLPKLSQLTTGPQSQHRVLAESRVQSDQTDRSQKFSTLRVSVQFSSFSQPISALPAAGVCPPPLYPRKPMLYGKLTCSRTKI
jgi:hypothetical protein